MFVSSNFLKFCILVLTLKLFTSLSADNQTSEMSPILPEKDLPFRVHIKEVKDQKGNPFLLPNGIQSYDIGVFKDYWLFINGRTNGLHGFGDDPDNFPPYDQNRKIYVVDIKHQRVFSRSLVDPESGLTQDQIDSLSVTSSQSFQKENTLYISGGYGFKRSINNYTTFDTLTAIDIPGLIKWVIHPKKLKKASQSIRQISDPIFKVTGGSMFQLTNNDPTLLVFGQDFEGAYYDQPVYPNQTYTKVVKRFVIQDDGMHLSVKKLPSSNLDENYRRRDLNIVPNLKKCSLGKGLEIGVVALSGVFTLTKGIWTVPVTITSNGMPSMLDPNDPNTFKQGMNNYESAFLSLYSYKADEMYTVLFGGLTYEFFDSSGLQQDAKISFTNEVTTIKINKQGEFTQHIMDAQYPIILSTQTNPGNSLLFGAAAKFIPTPGLENLLYTNSWIFKLDCIRKPLIIGYIVGGIQSTVQNTTTRLDSAASPHIFKVIFNPCSK